MRLPKLTAGVSLAGVMRTGAAGLWPAEDEGQGIVPMACTSARLRQLEAYKDTVCPALGCGDYDNCDTIYNKIVRATNCYLARDQINNECYDGGDPGHRQAADNAFRARERCNEYWVGKC